MTTNSKEVAQAKAKAAAATKVAKAKEAAIEKAAIAADFGREAKAAEKAAKAKAKEVAAQAKAAEKAAKAAEAAREIRVASGAPDRVIAADLSRYHFDKEVKTAGGHVSVDCNDKVAADLRGRALDAVYDEAARVLSVSKADLVTKYAHLHVGMQRMNLGNRMRAALKVAAGE